MSLQEKLDVLKLLDSEFIDLVDADHVADEIEEFKEDVYAVLVQAADRHDTTAPHSTSTSGMGPVSSSKVKLPKFTIQPFRGDLTAWSTFWDSYQAAIHDNTSLSNIDKFNYLRSLLQGSALDAISGLTLTTTNYQEAVDILNKRFGNKQQIVSKHMDALLNIDPVMSNHNLKALRQLYDTIESHVRGLKSLGVSADSYGSLLSSVLLNKLPQEIQLIVSRKAGSDDWQLDKLMKLLEEEVQARERAAASQLTSTSPRKPSKGPSTTSALMTTGNHSTEPTCCYCHQSHLSHLCRVVESVEARKRVLREAGRCFICLR